MTDRERNHFRNLLLLCKEHHNEVDRKANEGKYPVETLLAWKTAVEGSYAGDLDELDWLTEEKLQGLMVGAISETRTVIVAAIGRVKDISSETLKILKGLVLESFTRPYIDAEAVASLAYSAHVFERLPEHAEMLYVSSQGLQNLPDSTELLFQSSMGLQNVGHSAELLYVAADKLSSFQPSVEPLSNATTRLSDLINIIEMFDVATRRVDLEQLEVLVNRLSEEASAAVRLNDSAVDARDLEKVATRLEQASEDLASAPVNFDVDPDAWSWRSFRWGMGACLAIVVVLLTLFAIGITPP